MGERASLGESFSPLVYSLIDCDCQDRDQLKPEIWNSIHSLTFHLNKRVSVSWPSSTTVPGILAESSIRSRAVKTWTSPIWDAVVAASSLNSVPSLNFNILKVWVFTLEKYQSEVRGGQEEPAQPQELLSIFYWSIAKDVYYKLFQPRDIVFQTGYS